MSIRDITWGAGVLERLNARHPWSHNDHFHRWVLANLPDRRRTALDVGCGQGALLAALSPHFGRVIGIDRDAGMRNAAGRRCAGLPNVEVSGRSLEDQREPVDLVTMVAVLHHLDTSDALREVRRLLAPGGRFLVVGLAVPGRPRDHVWDAASIVTNPLIGLVKHPRPSREGRLPPAFPVRDPTLTFDQVGDAVRAVMPGARLRRRLGFRFTVEWTHP